MKVKTADLAEALGVSQRSIVKRAKKQQWIPTDDRVKGGGNVYSLTDLPLSSTEMLKVQAHLVEKKAVITMPPANCTDIVPSNPADMLPAVSGDAGQDRAAVRFTQEKKAYHKVTLLQLYKRALAAAPWGHKEQVREDFLIKYNSGITEPELYRKLGAVNYKTLESWKVKFNKSCGDPRQLVDRRGKKKGERRISSAQAEIIIAIARQPKGKSLSKGEIIRIAREVMKGHGIDTLSDATYRRFLDDWISVNYDQWIWWREGDKGLNDKCLPWVERDYDRIEVGDIVVADGHVLNFTILNPWTGKAQRMMLVLFFDMKSSMPLGWEIMPTENTAAISAALRRSIIRLGMVPKIVYLDNGRAFKGQYFTGTNFDNTELPGLYSSLGIKLIVAKPYHGQSKTIERFFKTFGELERMSPSFIGTAIDTKPAHLNRGEKHHRRINDQITQGYVPSLVDSHRAIAAWFDHYAARSQGPNSHLAGICPQEVFEAGRGPGVDQVALRVLMMKKEERKIYRLGVKVYDKGEWYYHPALYGRNHKVIVRYDLQHRDSVLVYDQRTDEFICEATQVAKVHPAASILGSESDVAVLTSQLEMTGELRNQTVSHAKALANEIVIPEAQRLIEDSGFAGSPETPRRIGSDGVMTAGQVIETQTRKTISFDFEKAKREAEENIRLQKEAEERDFRDDLLKLNDSDRYERLIELAAQGVDLGPEWTGFMAFFEQTSAYTNFPEYWESCRVKYGLMWRSENTASTGA